MKLLLPLLLIGSFAAAENTVADSSLTHHMGADAASQITFDSGRSTLTSDEITALNEMVSEARANNEKIDSVKVFVWGDKVYSETAGAAATSQEKKIADERVKNIKRYLQKDLKVSGVETYNMTRQPRAFSDLVKASGSTARAITAQNPSTGVAAVEPTAVSEFIKGSPSEALVLIYKK